MAGLKLTPKVRAEYNNLFNSIIIHGDRFKEVNAIIDKIELHREIYDDVVEPYISLPWYIVAIIHNMEAGLNFRVHLHNGDPLTARTVQVPKGRPRTGTPPFKFVDSARDAIEYENLDDSPNFYSISGTLWELEKYNGFGNRQHGIQSPYLYVGCQHYKRGKYVSDGVFSKTAVSKQIGAAVLLRRMIERQLVKTISDEAFVESLKQIKYGARGANVVALQDYLNSALPDVLLRPDGVAGPKTAAAFQKLFGVAMLK